MLERSRRDFLAWLAGGTAVSLIGCAADETSDAHADELADSALEAQTLCRATKPDAQGPYWEAGAPFRSDTLVGPNEAGVPLLLEGRLFGPDCKTLLKDYTLDIWQADANGSYSSAAGDYRLRGKIKTDQDGRYSVETILPGRYSDAAGMRPAHLHVTFLSPGQNELLTTQLYFKGDPFLGQADYCTRDGTCNSSDANRALKLRSGLVGNRAGKLASFDAVLPRA
jgi:catechol 1,2-dioxygenase